MCDTDWLCLLYKQITTMFHVYQIHSSDINVHWTTIPVDRHFKFVLKTSKTTRGIQKAGRLGQKKLISMQAVSTELTGNILTRLEKLSYVCIHQLLPMDSARPEYNQLPHDTIHMRYDMYRDTAVKY